MKKFAIAIHGGAESIKPGELDKEKEEKYRKGLFIASVVASSFRIIKRPLP